MLTIDRADMKLLTECGYSAILRNVAADPVPIFDALVTWMPEQGAGSIGHAMHEMVQGRFVEADDILSTLIASDRTGRDEARAILALVRTLRDDAGSAEALAGELEGQGGSAEFFTKLLVSGEVPNSQVYQGPVNAAAD